MTSQCGSPANCTSVFPTTQCDTTQPDSLNSLLPSLYPPTTCSCVTFNTLLEPCSAVVAQYAAAPAFAPTNNTYCTTPAATGSTAEIVVISLILVIFLGIPLGLYVITILMKQYVTGAMAEALTADAAATSQDIPPAILTFRDITFTVSIPKSNKKTKNILDKVTGMLRAKSLTAIMGPSGCGKSTLLDVLAFRGRGRASGVTGTIRVNGQPRGPYWKRIMAYVEQFDALFAHLTVREMLLFTAELRLSGTSRRHKEKQVTSVMRDLELEHVAGSLIGDPLSQKRGISGGQARRVTVGVELLSSPSILFLDEPTTGLDSASSQHLVQTLQKLALERGCCVACTIHQPRSSTFSLFDTLLLMIEGRVVYLGEIAALKSHLVNDVKITPPDKANLADFIVDMTYDRIDLDATTTTSTGSSSTTPDTLVENGTPPKINSVQRLAEAWADSAQKREVDRFVLSVENLSNDDPVPPPLDPYFATAGRFSQPMYFQMYVLLHRSFRNVSRNVQYWRAIALQNVQFLFFGLLFFGIQTEHLTIDAQSTNLQGDTVTWQRNFLYQVQNTVLVLESVVIATAFTEKRVFRREHAAGSYSSVAYHLTWFLRLQVDAIWKGFLAAILCYFFPGLNPAPEKFFFFAATLCVVSSLGSSLALFMASAVDDAEGAANIHNTIVGFMGTYAGFFLKSNLIPIFTLWAYYVSFEKYSLETLENNQWAGCASDAMRSAELSLDTTLNQWTNLLVLMVYPIVFHILALVLTAIHVGSASVFVDIPPAGVATSSAPPPATSSAPLPPPPLDNNHGSTSNNGESNRSVSQLGGIDITQPNQPRDLALV